MTSKVYRSAQGKSVDLGTIMLQNEHVRAVGNMGVNARGDKLDSMNRVIETKTEQIQKQNNRTSTNVSTAPVHTSSKKTRENKRVVEPQTQINTRSLTPDPEPTPVPPPVIEAPPPAPPVQQAPTPQPPAQTVASTPRPPAPQSPPLSNTQPKSGGLAGAIARTREIKQDLDRTRRQSAQDRGVRKI